MIYFDHLPLGKDILDALCELSINYVFQPIYQANGKTVFAREALMRPTEMTVTELIEKYTKENKLHVLEVATFFGATQEYHLRGYSGKVSLNSFPSEFFLPEEQLVFRDYYGDMDGKGVVEVLEYPFIDKTACALKREATKRQKLIIAIDDYGTGLNNSMDVIDMYNPKIIKLDRHLISDIDKLPEKQENVRGLVEEFHRRKLIVLAEGVERKEEFEWLVDEGCDLFQGYLLGMPK